MNSLLSQWQRELLNFKGIKSMFVLEKNVCDIYPYWPEDSECSQDVEFLEINELMRALFEQRISGGSYKVICYNPISRFANPFNDAELEQYLRAADREAAQIRLENERVNSFGSSGVGNGQRNIADIVNDTMLIRALLTRTLHVDFSGGDQNSDKDDSLSASSEAKPIAVVIDMASRMLSSPNALEAEEITAFSNLLIAARESLRVDGMNRNTLILIVNNLRDLPEWFISSNPEMRSLVIPVPDRETRQIYVETAFSLNTSSISVDGKSDGEIFIDKTDGMSLKELDELRRMYARQDMAESNLSSLVDVYKYGLKENKWASVIEKLERDPETAIKRRVKGQDQAVSAVVSVLKRSALGLSGATHSSSSKPKGILFLSGPTGTGKTEIVKSVAELLFGDERSLLRFDMSEYQSDNADQKLFGAPPGYVGYAEGGQLTNAVRANPFSVVLFDEIEKATSSIMDKFLQILEDGRMTDGQGNTVYFSETIIFFTSNIGFSEEVFDPSGRHVVDHVTLIKPGEPYESMQSKVMDSMKANFKPEFLGRIGNNVIVFNYIDDASAGEIVNARIDQINRTVESQHGVVVEAEPSCVAMLVERALQADVKEKGGRGIGNLIETEYLNRLSDFLFDSKVMRGEEIHALAVDDIVVFSRSGGEIR